MSLYKKPEKPPWRRAVITSKEGVRELAEKAREVYKEERHKLFKKLLKKPREALTPEETKKLHELFRPPMEAFPEELVTQFREAPEVRIVLPDREPTITERMHIFGELKKRQDVLLNDNTLKVTKIKCQFPVEIADIKELPEDLVKKRLEKLERKNMLEKHPEGCYLATPKSLEYRKVADELKKIWREKPITIPEEIPVEVEA